MSINVLRRIACDESGTTVIEYTMIATLVAGVIFVGVRSLGTGLAASIIDITTVLN
jgi:Flp pilus assembly pilin Flp